MERRGQIVIKIFIFISFMIYSEYLSGQELKDPEIINEDTFVKLLERNIIVDIFRQNPSDQNVVKTQGFYAILKIENGKVKEIIYPEGVDETIKRSQITAIRKINERIELKEFQFVDIDQVIVSCVFRSINYESDWKSWDEILKKLLPKKGYTQMTYVLMPLIIAKGNPKR